MAGRWRRYGGGASDAAAAASPKSSDIAGTLRQFASTVDAAKKAGAVVQQPGTTFNKATALMTGIAAFAAAGGAALRYGGPLISQKMQHDAEARLDNAARTERSVAQLRQVTTIGKPGRPWKRNAKLCNQGQCIDVKFVANDEGRLVANQADGSALENCHTNKDGKRVCEWKGKDWSEK